MTSTVTNTNSGLPEDSERTRHLTPLDSEPPERADSERVGRYELCFELASGGMASVYLARADGSSGFEKLVALKRIHRHLAKEREYVEMFLDEARIASRITHPNVCSVFDFGEAEGDYYIAMEYLLGEPLSRLCTKVASLPQERRSPLLPLRMARIVADACEGLHAAHELKDANGDLMHVVHRDVSTRNLFVTYGGGVQVVDFGIASARQRLHTTSTGEVKGTFPYMAPEQLAAAPIDRRVDIWALGVSLWELLTVRRLFRRDTAANTIHAVLYDEIEPPSAFRPTVSKELDAIVMKALERDPEHRWQTAREMGKALRKFLASQEQIIGPPELSEWMAELFPQGEARKSQLMEIARISDATVPALPHAGETEMIESATRVGYLEQSLPTRSSLPLKLSLVALLAIGAVLAVIGWRMSAPDPVDGSAPLSQSSAVEPEPTSSETGKSPVGALVNPAANPDLFLDADLLRKDGMGGATPEAAPVVPVPVEPPVEAKVLATKRKRAARATIPRQGSINLVTRGGWAKVYKGKRSLGTTPRKLTLPAGRHKLLLKPFGTGTPKTVWVNVEAKKTKKVSVTLD